MRVILLALVTAACSYDPPPEVALDAPEGGTFYVGDPLHLRFTEPVAAATLAVKLWPNGRDAEGEIPAGTVPLLDRCVAGAGSCGQGQLELDEDGLGAELVLDREGLGGPGAPMTLEVLSGLEDADGNARGVPAWFDFQVRPRTGMNTEPVEFDDGVYVIVADIHDPLPAVLTLITDMKVLPDGRAALAGAEGDEIGDEPKNTRDPTKLVVDATEEGYVVFTWGFVTLDGGERYLETEPLQMQLAFGPIVIQVKDVRISGKLVKHPDTQVDQIDGTFTFSGMTLNPGENQAEYEGGAVNFVADRAPDGDVPAGTPELCGDVCGAVIGTCDPPFAFPGDDFCQ